MYRLFQNMINVPIGILLCILFAIINVVKRGIGL